MRAAGLAGGLLALACSTFSSDSPPAIDDRTVSHGGGVGGAAAESGGTAGCVPQFERCDGLDNDCDGYVDAVPTPDGLFAVCECRVTAYLPTGSEAATGPDVCIAPPTCRRGANNEVEFSYAVGPEQWAACVFSTGQDLSGFDIENGAQGVIEVTYCVNDGESVIEQAEGGGAGGAECSTSGIQGGVQIHAEPAAGQGAIVDFHAI